MSCAQLGEVCLSKHVKRKSGHAYEPEVRFVVALHFAFATNVPY